MGNTITYREINQADKKWIGELVTKEWGSPTIVSRGKLHYILELPGIISQLHGEKVGLLTYVINGEACEIITLNSVVEGKGIGTGLIKHLRQIAKEKGCSRIWMITTNDNAKALEFYKKRGFRVAAIYPDVIEESRKLKPQIPMIGKDGIPIKDEIELEIAI